MAQIPILSGIYTNEASDYRVALPFNLKPVPVSTGVNAGYLRPAEGIDSIGTGPGIDRGGINWKGVLYRVMGTKLVSINAAGAVTTLGDVGAGGAVSLDYSFDRLAIWSGGHLFYWNGLTLVQVNDPDLGTVIDGIWVAGYFMSTDGEFLIVTELNAPDSVNPLKYGSSEADPDPVVGIEELRNEVYAFNRYTVEVFSNVGGDNFPFARLEGAQVPKGAIGTHAFCLFGQAFAMLGSGRNETPSVYLVGAGQAVPIATREVNQVLKGYDEATLSRVVLESVVDDSHQELWIRLPDQTLVYDAAASAALSQPVWSRRSTSVVGFAQHKAAFPVWVYDRWNVSDPASSAIGTLTTRHSRHWGSAVGHEFHTLLIYNEGNAAIVHELELVGLPGRVTFGLAPTLWTSYSLDGSGVWSQERPIAAGKQGERLKRLCWRTQGKLTSTRIQRFRWTSDTLLSVNRLEASLELLRPRHG